MDRVRDCGRTGVLPDGSVRVRASGSGDARRAGFAGVSTCGSVWACPVCAERILSERSDEVRRALEVWTGLAGRVGLVTLTMRHRRGQSLSALWDALSYAWHATTSGRAWKDAVSRYGIEGFVKVVEVTHGRHGWHVHVHAALLLPSSTSAADLDQLHARMVDSWTRALNRRNLTASSLGQDARLWDLGDVVDEGRGVGAYFTKADYRGPDAAARELTRADRKVAKNGNRTPFAILADLVENGDADDLDLWEEWERASKGRRQVAWSKGLRARLLSSDERSDEEIAADELGSEADDLVEIPAAGWRLVTQLGIDDVILDQAEEDDGGAALRRYLTARGVPFRELVPVAATEAGA